MRSVFVLFGASCALQLLLLILATRLHTPPAGVEFSLHLLACCAALLGLRQLIAQLRLTDGAPAEAPEETPDLSASIEHRFADWNLTPAERDVAWFTMKGLSIGEIAHLRGTSEGTVKAQGNAIYRKAGVSGRVQLLAAFMDELILSGQNASEPELMQGPTEARARA